MPDSALIKCIAIVSLKARLPKHSTQQQDITKNCVVSIVVNKVVNSCQVLFLRAFVVMALSWCNAILCQTNLNDVLSLWWTWRLHLHSFLPNKFVNNRVDLHSCKCSMFTLIWQVINVFYLIVLVSALLNKRFSCLHICVPNISSLSIFF